MSTVPAAASAPDNSYWRQPATVLQMLLWAVPFLFAFGWWLTSMYFTVQAQARDNSETRATIAKWQDVKEDRTRSLAILETQVKALHDDVKELRGDVKLLLQRGDHR